MGLLKYIKQMFCKHNYTPTTDEEYDNLINKLIEETYTEGGTFCYTREHYCTKCGKLTTLGSGQIC